MSHSHQKDRCVILGGGGHARVVIEALKACDAVTLYGILERDNTLWGKELLGIPILGGDDLLATIKQRGVTHFVNGVGGDCNNEPRKKVYEAAVSAGLTPLTVKYPSSVCSDSATIGAGTVILPQAVVNAKAVIGANVIVNTGVIVEHDCVIGDHVHLATGSRLSGQVRVGDGAHIGTGASIRNNIAIGENSIVGVGSAVVSDVAPNTTVTGSPAK